MEDIHKGDIGTRLDFAVALVKEEADAGLLLRVHRGHSCLHSIASDVQARTQTTSNRVSALRAAEAILLISAMPGGLGRGSAKRRSGIPTT